MPARRTSTPLPRAVALPASANAFRLLGGGDDLQWIGDDMGGAADPDGPKPTRRDFLVRVAVAAGVLAAGGALNALTMALAGRSDVAQATGVPESGRR